MKHTPGKWEVDKVEGKRLTCVYTNKTNIALLVHQEDAKLIASAPELLEVCKELVKCYDLKMGKCAREVRIEIARDIIKKLES